MLVSIIIPVYNVAPYIESCLKSVMLQKYSGDIECLIVDDCGTDESISIAEHLIAEYEGPIRFEILRHKHNRGLSAARNTGMRRATGDYILFIDSDDEISVDCIEQMMVVVSENPDLELVQGSCLCHRNKEEYLLPNEIRIKLAYTNDEVRRCFYQYKQIQRYAWNKLMKRSFIEENNLFFIEGLLYEDTPWTFYWLKYIKNAYFMTDVTYHYKIRPNSIVTGCEMDITEISRLKGYHCLLTNLTQGYERQEVDFFSPFFVVPFLHQSYHMPELAEDLKILLRFAWLYKEYRKCTILGFFYFFRRSKLLGRGVCSIIYRLKHPSQIHMDFSRLCRWAKG